jgi:excisionase family DNA binding protein
MMMQPTLSVPEAAAMMHVHVKTVLDLIAAGAVPAGKVGRAYVMLTKDVMAYIEARVVQQTAQRMRRPFTKAELRA